MHYIVIKTSFVGFHRYKDAPEEVAFLRDYHRHVFGVEVLIEANHSNRDIEFFIQKSKLDKILLQFSGWENRFEYSCEQLAEIISNYVKAEGNICSQVEVSEDGENIGGYLVK